MIPEAETFRSRKRPSGTSGAHSRLDPEEERQQRRSSAEQAECPGGQPARIVAVDNRVDREHQRRRDRGRTREIEAASRVRAATGWEQGQAEGEHRRPDREVDEEDRVPAERARQDAAEERAERATPSGDETEEAHCLRPLSRRGEEGHDKRERDRRDDRAAQPLHRARPDEGRLRACEAAAERGECEERDADEEDAPVAEEVAEPPAEQEEAAEGEQIAVHDPRERARGEAEVRADRGQRDADNRRIEDDHQVPHAEDEEREPARVAVADLLGKIHRTSSLVWWSEGTGNPPPPRDGQCSAQRACGRASFVSIPTITAAATMCIRTSTAVCPTVTPGSVGM